MSVVRNTGEDTGAAHPHAVHLGLLRPLLAPLLLLTMALPGCGGTTRDAVQLSGMRIALSQAGEALADTGEFVIQVGDAKPILLQGHTTARIEAVWVIGEYRLALIIGSTKACPRQETLLVARGESGQARPLGKCQDRFAFSLSGEQWGARQSNGRDPINWTFRDGALSGPVAQSVLNARRRRAEPERANLAEPSRDPTAPPSQTPDPMQAPPISRPVGDDVVPPPIGAGPLPGRPTAAPRVF